MTPALERLAELVRQAEAKTRAKKLTVETQQAAEQFRAAEARARQASRRLREDRPARLRELEQADADEQQLRDLVRKLAQFKTSLDPDAEAESLIDTAQAEIRRKRDEARAALEAIAQVVEEARRDLRAAIDHYLASRRELDRPQPQLAVTFAADDRLLWEAETHFPGGQLQALSREVEASLNSFAGLAKMEQYAQLKIWIGRFRLYQALGDEGAGDEPPQAQAQRLFHLLKTLSKQYEPGYIEAFRHDYSTDWPSYIAEAQDQLLQAIEASRRPREKDKAKDHEPPKPSPRGPARPHDEPVGGDDARAGAGEGACPSPAADPVFI